MSDILSSSSSDRERRSNGIIGIKGGRVMVTDPVGGGSPALLFPVAPAVVAVNGQELKSSMEVYAADTIEIIPRGEIIPSSVQVEIAPDAMSARIRVLPRVAITRKITDHHEQEKLIPVLAEEKEEFAEITSEDAILALKRQGVVFGLQDDMIENIVSEADGQWYPVAWGEEPVKGENGYIELNFTPGYQKVSYDEKNLARVDYRERFSFSSVEEGEILGILHPPVPGKPGMTITGAWLDPPELKEERARCGLGCKLMHTETGSVVIATQNGMPHVERNEELIFHVSPLLIHQEDVDLKSGNLHFKGDLKIAGNIVEGMTIECWGGLEVTGQTAGSDLLCGGSAVFFNHLVNSCVTVGIFKDIYLKLSPRLDMLEDILIEILQGIDQIEQPLEQILLSDSGKETEEEKTQRNTIELINNFIERKEEQVEELCGKALKIFDEIKMSLPVSFERDLRETCSCFLQAVRLEKAEKKDLINIFKMLKDIGTLVKKWGLTTAGINAAYVQNCRIYSSGDIKISGVGSYNSHYTTPVNVYVDGFFRGGSIFAGGDVFINEAGSPALPLKQGVITLKAGSAAYFHRVYENVRVVFDQCEYKFPLTKTMVKVYYDEEDDRIIVTPYKN